MAKPTDLEAIIAEARAYLPDAMREPTESYPPVFATYVVQGVPSASASVLVDTALTAIAFAIMAERAAHPIAHLTIAQGEVA
jgi:hypothetical protein